MKLTHSSKLGLLLLALSLTGCTSVNEKITGWLSSNVDAIGVLDGKIMRGKAIFPNEREATLQLQSNDTPSLTCLGLLRYTATNSGVVNFTCNDGSNSMVPFQSRSVLSGVGRGLTGKAEFALTYGLSVEKAASFLALPIERLTEPTGK
jgi:hypothetical protein